VGVRRVVAEHEQLAHVSPFDEPCAAALRRSGGGGLSWPDPPHCQLGSGLWAIEAASFTTSGGCSGRHTRPRLRSACKERPFLDHSARNGPGSPPGPGLEQRDSLVRLSAWTPRGKSSNRRGRGSEQFTRPPTSARSARSSRWSTQSSRSERGCSCPTRSSGRDVPGLSLFLRARRFPSGPIRPKRRQARSEDAAGAGRRCSQGSCSLQAQRRAASSVESTRLYPGSKLGCGR